MKNKYTNLQNCYASIVTELVKSLNNAKLAELFTYRRISMKNEVNLKPPRTFDEQIEILRSRNIIINDKEKARKILSTVNYYRLTGYALHIKCGEHYMKGYTMESIFGIYSFDKRMRNILMDALETVEISMRTSIAYVVGHKYGPDGICMRIILKWLTKIENIIRSFYKS